MKIFLRAKNIINIAFIDDGINPAYFKQRHKLLSYKVEECAVTEEEATTRISHGTSCFSVFEKAVTKKAKYNLISLNVIEQKEYSGKIKNLSKAISWCIENNVNLINLSIGTREYSDINELYPVISLAADKGIIIVAACNNNNSITFPACFPMVIGVRHISDNNLIGKYNYDNDAFDMIEVKTNIPEFTLYDKNKNPFFNCSCNSFATPFITAKVFNIMADGHFKLDKIKQILRLNSTPISKAAIHNSNLVYSIKKLDALLVIVDDKFSLLINELISLFRANGYNAVFLSCNKKTDFQNHIFKLKSHDLNTEEMIDLYYSYLLPDIMFVKDTELFHAELVRLCDFVLSDIANASDSADMVYRKIVAAAT